MGRWKGVRDRSISAVQCKGATVTPLHHTSMVRFLRFISGLAWVGLMTSCQKSADKDTSTAAPPSVGTSQQVFQVTGLVVAVNPLRKQVEIKHEAIPGYMPAMTMPFEVKQSAELGNLRPGLAVTFRLNVRPTEVWIDQIHGGNSPATNGPPPGSEVRVVRDVQPLELGDALPECHLIDESGRPISTAQFKGQVLAITFLFTRCPLPNFCPLMANHFAAVQKKLLAMPNAPTNWHLLTISFDPEFDKPEVLKAYAQAYHY